MFDHTEADEAATDLDAAIRQLRWICNPRQGGEQPGSPLFDMYERAALRVGATVEQCDEVARAARAQWRAWERENGGRR